MCIIIKNCISHPSSNLDIELLRSLCAGSFVRLNCLLLVPLIYPSSLLLNIRSLLSGLVLGLDVVITVDGIFEKVGLRETASGSCSIVN